MILNQLSYTKNTSIQLILIKSKAIFLILIVKHVILLYWQEDCPFTSYRVISEFVAYYFTFISSSKLTFHLRKFVMVHEYKFWLYANANERCAWRTHSRSKLKYLFSNFMYWKRRLAGIFDIFMKTYSYVFCY